MKRHGLTVQSERRERLIEAYAQAQPEAKQRAESTLERLRTPGAGSAAPHSLRTIDRALRSLQGREQIWVQDIADALDLRPVPGVLEARTQGQTEAVTVYVAPVYRGMDWKDVDLSLIWISPTGEEITARREPVAAAAFQPQGFEMYVRAPAGPAGTWSLVAEIERDGERARGLPVAVETTRDFGARWRSIAGRDWPAGSAASLYAHSLRLLTQRGLRLLSGVSPARQLAALESYASRPAAEPEGAHVFEIAFVDRSQTEHWIWSFRPQLATRGAVVLLVPQREAPEVVLSRPAWTRFAREQAVRLFATHLPSDFAREGTIASLLERIRTQAEVGLTLCVARGETADALPVGLMGLKQLPLDGVVFSTVIHGGAPESVLSSLPKLLIAPGGHAAWPEEDTAHNLIWVQGANTPLLNEPALPRLTARWMEARFRAEDPAK